MALPRERDAVDTTAAVVAVGGGGGPERGRFRPSTVDAGTRSAQPRRRALGAAAPRSPFYTAAASPSVSAPPRGGGGGVASGRCPPGCCRAAVTQHLPWRRCPFPRGRRRGALLLRAAVRSKRSRRCNVTERRAHSSSAVTAFVLPA